MPSVRFRLNGVELEVDADPDRALLDVLRGQLGVTGPHFGCGAGECGACNVIVGDRAVSACDTPLWSAADKDVTTIGSNVFIGSNTSLVAPVSVGDGAYTASGSVISHDVPADALAFGRARQENKPGYAPKLKEKALARKAAKQKGKA